MQSTRIALWLLAISAVPALGRASARDVANPTRGCGEICVQLLCHYYQVPFDREVVLESLQPGKMGETTVARLCETLQVAGFTCRAVTGTFESIRQTDELLIVFAKSKPDDAIGHFALARWNEPTGAVTIFDPLVDERPISTSEADFIKLWTGVAILVSPPGESPRNEYYLYIAVAATATAMGLAFERSLAAWRDRRRDAADRGVRQRGE